MQNKLLPCPFCSNKDVRLQHRGRTQYGYYVICKNCGCRTPLYQYQFDSKEKRREEAIKQWNTRKPMERIVAELQTIYDQNDKCKKENYEEQNWEEFDMFSNRNEGIFMAIEIVKGGVDNAGK